MPDPSLESGQDAWSGFAPFGLGLGLAMVAAWLLNGLRPEPRLDLLAVALGIIGAVYLGSALAEKRGRSILLEAIATLVCAALALAGLWVSPLALVAGYGLHGLWDFFHHPVPFGAQIPQRWYPPLCVGFDWAIAAAIAWQYFG